MEKDNAQNAKHIENKKMEHTYRLINKEYQAYLAYRNRMIKWGLISLLTLPFIFMIMMFFLPSKIVFLCLWIISFILIAIFLAYVEYKGYYYQKLMGINEQSENVGEDKKI